MLEQLESMRFKVSNIVKGCRSVDVDDVIQESVIAILGGYSQAPRTKTYWTALSARRSAIRARNRDDRYYRENSGELVTDCPLAALIQCEDLKQLQSALGKIESRHLEAIELRYFEGLTMEHVGVRLGVSKPQACKRVAKALEALRELMV